VSSEEEHLPASVSVHVLAERALQEHIARLEESNRFHQLFVDILSHDLMNPVWIAENYLRLVMDGGVPDDKRPFYDGMRGSLAKARGILADARTYLRIQDLVAFTGEKVDLGRIAEEVLKSLGPLGEEKGQTISATIVGGAVIRATPLIKEVAWQLLANAIKFAPRDTAIVVSVSDGPRVRLEVRDRGPGVPEPDRESIFLRFGGMEKGPITGVGLGLAIVRRVVDLHGGRVWVEDNPGGGSIFIADFPAAD
jgi:signal transduction histidine kinase